LARVELGTLWICADQSWSSRGLELNHWCPGGQTPHRGQSHCVQSQLGYGANERHFLFVILSELKKTSRFVAIY
jgi:hypothetical protein